MHIFLKRFLGLPGILMLVVISSFSGADFTPVFNLDIKGTYLTADRLGGAYVVTPTNELVKIDPVNNYRVTRFSLVKYGKPTLVDATNPLKVLVYFKDFNIIVLLDNTLSEKGVLRLQEKGILQTTAACTSLDNNIWIYDALIYKLRKLDDNLNIIQESEDFTLLFDDNLTPTFLLEADNRLFANVPDHGILVFDVYGGYMKTIPLKGLDNFQVVKDQLLYFKDGQLYSYHLQSFQTRPIDTPKVPNAKQVKLLQDYLIVLLDNRLTLYAR